MRRAEGRTDQEALLAVTPGEPAGIGPEISVKAWQALRNEVPLLWIGDPAHLPAGTDVHRATAAEVFGIAPERVTADQRRSAKAINFGLMYGMSAFGLSRQLDIDRGEVNEVLR